MIMLLVVGGLVVSLLLIGLYHPRTGAQALKWQPTRSAEVEVQNEIDDLDQMLEAANARRRRRGADELTEETLHTDVRAHTREQSRRREDYMAELEIAQMLDATNAKRRDRGEPELTLPELRAELGL